MKELLITDWFLYIYVDDYIFSKQLVYIRFH